MVIDEENNSLTIQETAIAISLVSHRYIISDSVIID